MRKRIEELEGIVNPQKILIKELTIELGNYHKMFNRLKNYKNEKEVITGKLRRLKQRFRILEEKIRQDENKVKLGETILNLPNLGRK